MNVTYTLNAKSELQTFQERQQHILEDIIKRRKYVFGDEVLEITASDIRDASRFIQPIITERANGLSFRRLILNIYFVLGLTLTGIGLLYPLVIDEFRKNPTQATLSLSGVALTLMSVIMSYYLKFKEERHRQIMSLVMEDVVKSSEMSQTKLSSNISDIRTEPHDNELCRLKE